MSYFKKLLQGVDVKWTSLGDENFIEIANRGRKPVESSLRLAGEIPYYGANNIQDYVEGYTHSGEFVLIAEDGTTSIENYSIQYANGKFWANNHVHVIKGKDELSTRFLFHYLRIVNFIPFLSGRIRAKLTKGKLIEIQIPILPLEIQKEIVNILDSFTELTTELKAELKARKKQYAFYRKELLTFGEEIEWKALGEIALIGTGSHDTQDAVDYGNYTFYARGITPLKLNSYDFDETAIITAGDGVGVGKVFHWAVGKYALHQRAYRIVPNADVSSRYIYHYMVANFYSYIQKTSVHSSVTSLRKPMFLKFPIPVPPIEEQKRIVGILDQFDILTNSLSGGIPREIELRQKQYEYYRNLLLTFPKD
ncbi:restriction endonuclease subunit S [Pedobacter sp. UBA5917]|jgi:type I restriction enzyme S subunit|uniref:restriction endonuclease subunit S n=1 Tax=Pedobacter sp. UBA5917 TaxID=1947061 RepID=UPI0025F03B0E|nr:restriction endonuclease subunit S [Pedobacter sp. UBA5917]